MLERLQTDILILGSGGAGLFAALHALRANPISRSPWRRKACSASPAARGWCRAATMSRSRRATRSSGISWTRSRAASGCRISELAWTPGEKAVERVRELENEIGCFFDRNADGTLHGKAFAGQTFDRTVHKGDLTGIEIINRLMEQVWARPASSGWRSIAPSRSSPRPGGAVDRGRADDRHPHRRCSASSRPTPCCWPPAAGRPCTAITRRRATRAWTGSPWRCGSVCRCATWRWCSSTRPALLAGPDTRMTGTVLEEGLRGAGGHSARRRNGASWPTTTRSSSAPRATWSRVPSTRRCAPAAPRPTAASTSRWAISGRTP